MALTAGAMFDLKKRAWESAGCVITNQDDDTTFQTPIGEIVVTAEEWEDRGLFASLKKKLIAKGYKPMGGFYV